MYGNLNLESLLCHHSLQHQLCTRNNCGEEKPTKHPPNIQQHFQPCSSAAAAAHHLNETVKACKKKNTCLPSDRDKDVEDADHDAPFAPSKEIAYDGRSDGGIAGFSGPDQASQQGEKPELLHRQKHQRHSTCFLSSAHGYMHGESSAQSVCR